MKPFTLKWWLTVYDKSKMEQNITIEDDNYIRDHFCRPYNDKTIQDLKNIDDRYERYEMLTRYIYKRILKKYGE